MRSFEEKKGKKIFVENRLKESLNRILLPTRSFQLSLLSRDAHRALNRKPVKIERERGKEKILKERERQKRRESEKHIFEMRDEGSYEST